MPFLKWFQPLFIFFFLSISIPAQADSFATYSKSASVTGVGSYVSATSESINVRSVIKGFAANDPYAVRNLALDAGSTLAFFKNNIGSLVKKNAFWIGFAATVAAAGWAINELTNEVTQVTTTYRGKCVDTTSYIYYVQENMLLDDCTAALGAAYHAAFPSLNGSFAYSVQQPNAIDLYFYDVGYGGQLQWPSTVAQQPQPVSDADFNTAVMNQLATASPADAARAFLDDSGKPQPAIFDPVKPEYIPGVDQTDEQWLACYWAGQLQNADPGGSCYATAETSVRIAGIAASLAAGQTPEAQVSAANATVQAAATNGNPLTQEQYDASNLRDRTAESAAIAGVDIKPVTDAYTNSGLGDSYTTLKDRIDNIDGTTLPGLPEMDNLDLPEYGTCQSITGTWNGYTISFPSPEQCAKLDQIKTGFGYVLYLLTAFGIIVELFRRVE